MHTRLAIPFAAAAAVLAGCAGSTQTATPTALAATANARGPIDVQPDGYEGVKDIYVSDLGASAVQMIRNKGYFYDGSISSGMVFPSAVALDRSGNLYVSDYGTVSVTEFPPGSSSPSHTYSAGMEFPVNVTADRNGNVYEADQGIAGEYDGFVAEYPQGKDHVVGSCSPHGNVEGVAVDQAGDVFVSYNLSSQGKIVEYTGGLKGCKATTLGATFADAGGIALDDNHNIIICDRLAHVIEVLAPPYSSVTRTIGPTTGNPYNATIDKSNTKVFAADDILGAVYVIDYASGATLVTIKGGYFGLNTPTGAVDGPDDVH
jgi:DNA-binding beta-propeller fold protein YncE